VLPYLFAGPALLFLVVLLGYPLISTVVFSFYSYDFVDSQKVFVGFGNFIKLFDDPVFHIAAKNALLFVVFSVVVQIPIGLVLAALLDRGVGRRASTIFRTIIFAPMVLSIVAVGLLWQLILDPLAGFASFVVKLVGLKPPVAGWLGDPDITIYVIMFIAFWQYIGFCTILLLAGAQRIDDALYEAAMLDGASAVQSFFAITVPLLRNTIIVVALLSMIGALRVFDFVYVLTGGGPGDATQVPATMIYKEAFYLGHMGYANAISVLLLIVTVALGFVQLRYSRRS
jgi:raffinose/stachyose/melibiose transport system permease protein